MRIVERVYRAVLRAYPLRFRREVGPELLSAFRRMCKDDGRRGWALVAELIDLLRNLPAEWWARGRDRRRSAPGRKKNAPALFSRFLSDARVALRGFRRRPGFSVAVAVVLGLGIGATTAIFTVVNAVLLRPLPYAEPDRLVTVWQTFDLWRDSPNPILRALTDEFPLAWRTYRDWLEMNTSFDALAVHKGEETFAWTGAPAPEMVRGVAVSSRVFKVLGVPPLHGRVPGPEGDEPGAPPTVVLGYGFWMSRFGGDPSAVGRTMVLDEIPHTIVGVMPPSFYYPTSSARVWTSVPERDKRMDAGEIFWGIGRLRPGSSLDQAEREMVAVNRRIQEREPNHVYGVRLQDRREDLVGEARPALALLIAFVTAVLLITCANVSNLLLMRSLERRQELAIRTALGAGRSRLLSQLLTESLVLAALGGAAGLALAFISLEPMVAWLPPEIPRASEIRLDGTVLLVSVAVTVGTGLLTGLLPALLGARKTASAALPTSGPRTIGGRSHSRLRMGIVVTEIALSFLLLVGAGGMVRSMVNLGRVELGFEVQNLATLHLQFRGSRNESVEARSHLLQDLRHRLLSFPGVMKVSVSDWVPFVETPRGGGLYLVDPSGPRLVNVSWNRVSDSFFEVLGIPLVSGRPFGIQDMGDQPRTAIVSETLARTYWPGRDPIGERVGRTEDRGLTVVGVAADIRHPGYGSEWTADPRSLVYLPANTGSVVALRTDSDPGSVLRAAQSIVGEVDPDLPVVTGVVADNIREATANPRFRTWAAGGMAGLAALLASFGILGVMSYAVEQRAREFGVRMALGATVTDLTGIVARQGILLIGCGLAAGLVGLLGLAKVTSSLDGLLFQVNLADPMTIGVVSLLLALIAGCAAIIPVARAAGVDPASTLKME